jgi:hypothetical protein
MEQHEVIARAVADCLQAHLHEYGWEPFRYPSGEHKGVDAQFHCCYSDVTLIGADGSMTDLIVAARTGKTI